MTVRAGDENIELKLVRAGSIAGSVLLDPGVPADAVRIGLVGGANATPPKEDGSFVLENLPAGNATLRIGAYVHGVSLTSGEEKPVVDGERLVIVSDLRVVPGRTNRDPRIQSLDLRGRLHVFKVSVIDSAGRPVAGARVTPVREGNRPVIPGQLTDSRGVATFVSTKTSLMVSVRKAKFIGRRTDLSSGENEIVLVQGYVLKLRLAEGTSYPDRASLLLVRVSPEGKERQAVTPDESESGREDPFSFTRGWTQSLSLPGPGRYQVRLRIMQRLETGSGIKTASLDLSESTTIEIAPGELLNERALVIGEADLQRALQKLR